MLGTTVGRAEAAVVLSLLSLGLLLLSGADDDGEEGVGGAFAALDGRGEDGAEGAFAALDTGCLADVDVGAMRALELVTAPADVGAALVVDERGGLADV
jgi:hypothetical protein